MILKRPWGSVVGFTIETFGAYCSGKVLVLIGGRPCQATPGRLRLPSG
jgi:hypothetical protein